MADQKLDTTTTKTETETEPVVVPMDDEIESIYPTNQQIADWHIKYPHSALRGYPFPGTYVVYRSYTMAEEEAFLDERAEYEQT